MLIFNAPGGDPMLLDSAQGLRVLHERLLGFIHSGEAQTAFAALTPGNPEPYAEFLGGLRVRKEPANSQLRISDDRWLELSAPSADLQAFADRFVGLADGNHHHWYSMPVSLIIEADDWRAAHAS